MSERKREREREREKERKREKENEIIITRIGIHKKRKRISIHEVLPSASLHKSELLIEILAYLIL